MQDKTESSLMLIDFSPLRDDKGNLPDFASRFTVADLKKATNTYIDTITALVDDLSDEQLTFDPEDPHADDPAASNPEDRYIPWNLAHLVLHVTASSEEGAAFGSMLARGVVIPAGIRLRYEPNWREVTTKEQVLQRLQESRRIRLAYLDTFPDDPHLDLYRPLDNDSPLNNKINAVGSVLFGLMHEDGHLYQMREVRRQALAAINSAGV